MTKKILILDFDGTLADTRHIIVTTMQQTIQALHLPQRTDNECAAMIGLPLSETFRTLIPMDESMSLQCAATYRRLFDENNVPGAVPVFPNVVDTLCRLHERGIVITIASSRSHASLADFVQRMHLDSYISYVLGADDVSLAKPHPEPVLKTLRELGFKAAEAVVVGDTTFDIDMGRRAGAATVGVTYGNGTREQLEAHEADIVIDDFAQLLPLFD